MATFLELVQDLARETGSASPDAITSVTSSIERVDKMVHWVRKGYDNIQNDRYDWRWLRTEFTHDLTNGQPCYTAAALGLTRWARWMEDSDELLPLSLYKTSTGVTDEGPLRQLRYDTWYQMYGRGDTDPNRPVDWTISPDGELCFGPTPDDTYTVHGWYWKSPQVLAANGDTPEMPPRFHDLIVYEARRLLLIHDGAYNEAVAESPLMARMRFQLEMDQLPEVVVGGGSLA